MNGAKSTYTQSTSQEIKEKCRSLMERCYANSSDMVPCNREQSLRNSLLRPDVKQTPLLHYNLQSQDSVGSYRKPREKNTTTYSPFVPNATVIDVVGQYSTPQYSDTLVDNPTVTMDNTQPVDMEICGVAISSEDTEKSHSEEEDTGNSKCSRKVNHVKMKEIRNKTNLSLKGKTDDQLPKTKVGKVPLNNEPPTNSVKQLINIADESESLEFPDSSTHTTKPKAVTRGRQSQSASFGSEIQSQLFSEGNSKLGVMKALLAVMTGEEKISLLHIVANRMRNLDRKTALATYLSTMTSVERVDIVRAMMNEVNAKHGGSANTEISSLISAITGRKIRNISFSTDSQTESVPRNDSKEDVCQMVSNVDAEKKDAKSELTSYPLYDDIRQNIREPLDKEMQAGPVATSTSGTSKNKANEVEEDSELVGQLSSNTEGNEEKRKPKSKKAKKESRKRNKSHKKSPKVEAEQKCNPCDTNEETESVLNGFQLNNPTQKPAISINLKRPGEVNLISPNCNRSLNKYRNNSPPSSPKTFRNRSPPVCPKRYRIRSPPASPDGKFSQRSTSLTPDSQYLDPPNDEPSCLLPWKLLQVTIPPLDTRKRQHSYMQDNVPAVSQDTVSVDSSIVPVSAHQADPATLNVPYTMQRTSGSYPGPFPSTQISYNQSCMSVVQYNMPITAGPNTVPNANMMQPNSMEPLQQVSGFGYRTVVPQPPPQMSDGGNPMHTIVNNISNCMNIRMNNNVGIQQQGYQSQFNNMSQPQNSGSDSMQRPHISRSDMSMANNIPIQQGANFQTPYEQRPRDYMVPSNKNVLALPHQNFQQPMAVQPTNTQNTEPMPGGIGETPDNNIICITNLPSACTAKMLRDLFIDYGRVTYSAILATSEGILQFATHAEAALAVSSMNQAKFNGLLLHVRFY